MATTENLLATHIEQAQYQKEVTANAAFDIFDKAIAGREAISVAGASDVTLTDAQSRNAMIELTGTLTGSINLIVPTRAKIYCIYNNTSGAYTITVKTTAGTGKVVDQGQTVLLRCDETNVEYLDSQGDYRLNTLARLASASIDGQTLTKQTVFTVPTGRSMIPVFAVARSASGSLVGLNDMDLGGDAGAGDWLMGVTLEGLTTSAKYVVLTQAEGQDSALTIPAVKPIYAAATVFGVKINTGATGAETFTLDLFGYLF